MYDIEQQYILLEEEHVGYLSAQYDISINRFIFLLVLVILTNPYVWVNAGKQVKCSGPKKSGDPTSYCLKKTELFNG